MEYFCEVTSEVNKRFTHIINVKDLSLYKGFSSMYCFDETAVGYFRSIGAVKNLKNFPVGASKLTIDIDNDEEAMLELKEKLLKSNYKFQLWCSGGKGYHFVLFHDFMFDKLLPYWHKKWVTDRRIKCDECIYNHGRLIRLPHTVHHKTGKLKELLLERDGVKITLDTSFIPQVVLKDNSIDEEDFEFSVNVLSNQLAYYVSDPVLEGSRNNRLFKIIMAFKGLGMSSEAVEEFAYVMNDNLETPIEEDELKALINSCLR